MYLCLYVSRETGRVCGEGNWQMGERHSKEHFVVVVDCISNHLSSND